MNNIKISPIKLWLLFPTAAILSFCSCSRQPPADESGPMTLERFREITSSAGDNIPLQQMLAKVPWWSNTVTRSVYTNFSTEGEKVLGETLRRTARTVKGKYIVYSGAEADQQGRNVIKTYDERSSSYKFYSTAGLGTLADGTIVYDFTNKTYSYTTTFAGMKVIGHGSYSNTHESETSSTYSDNQLLAITVQEIEAVNPGEAERLH